MRETTPPPPESVRPNPAPRPRYDLVVVGAGAAGLEAARTAAALGAKVAIVEAYRVGGHRLNEGAVSTHALQRTAQGIASLRHAAALGLEVRRGDLEFPRVIERLKRRRVRVARGTGLGELAALGLDVFLGAAKFTDERTVEVAGTALRFDHAIVATGARPAPPPIRGLLESGFLTLDGLLQLAALPKRLVVVGGDAEAAELAQALARLGARVTLLEPGPRLLPDEDPEAAELVLQSLLRDHATVLPDARVAQVVRVGEQVGVAFSGTYAAQSPVTADALFVSRGRAPNVEALALEAAGVAYDRRGVKVDDRLRTTNKAIHAAGDVVSSAADAAEALGRLAALNALSAGGGKASELVVPRATWTEPEIAHVGLTAEAAARAGVEVESFRVSLDQNERVVAEELGGGFVKAHVRAGTDALVGATVVGEEAGELLAPFVVAMQANLGLGALAGVALPYPSRARALVQLAETALAKAQARRSRGLLGRLSR